MNPLLNFRQLGEQGPALILLHGLYGSGRNWASIARRLAADYRVWMPDLRNHGSSFHAQSWDYPSMAQDLEQLRQALQLERFALLGHSMGGKVAMQYALDYGQALEQLVIVDIAPKPYGADYHRGLLQALSQLDLGQLSSREEASQQLAAAIPEADVRAFILMNLQRTAAGWQWQFNLPVLQAQLENITGNLSLEGRQPFDSCPVLFIAGERSDYLKPQDLPAVRAYFPQAGCEWIANAGHWVHAEQPDALLSLLKSFLGSQI